MPPDELGTEELGELEELVGKIKDPEPPADPPVAPPEPEPEPAAEPIVDPAKLVVPDPDLPTEPVAAPVKPVPPAEPAVDDIAEEDMTPEQLRELLGSVRGQLNSSLSGQPSFFEETSPTSAEPAPSGTPAEPAIVVATPGAVVPAAAVSPAAAPVVGPLAAVPVVTPAEWKDQNFIGDIPIDEYLDSPEKLNQLLNAVAKAAGKSIVTPDVGAVKTEVLKGLPEVVGKYVAGMVAMRTMAQEFYEEHVDLKPYKNLVAAAANSLSAKHQDWTVQQVFDEAAPLARKSLGLRNRVKTREVKDPSIVRPSGVRKTSASEQLSSLQKEVGELIDF